MGQPGFRTKGIKKLFNLRDRVDQGGAEKRQWKEVALEVTYDEWREVVDSVDTDEQLRVKIARIVWWDFFGKAPASMHNSQLDGYVNNHSYGDKGISRSELIKALHKVGYLFCVAQKRIRH